MERNIEEEKERSFGRGGDDRKACAIPARGQPVLFILVWLACSSTRCQHNLFLFSVSLLPEVMDVKQRRFCVHCCTSKHNCLYFISDPFAASNSDCSDEDAETVTS